MPRESMNVARFKAPQLSRMALILQWLREKRKFNSESVVDFYQGGASVRTIKNDIENLRTLGFAVEFNYHSKSYVLTDDSGDLPLPQIRKSEIAVLHLATQLMESIGAEPLTATAESFVNRVRELMPALTGKDLSTLSPSLTILSGPRAENSFPHYEELSKAVRNDQSVEIDYFTMSRNESSTRVVDPYKLLSKEGRSYMIAWCHTREHVAIFRLDRIQDLRPTNDFFERNEDFDETAFLKPMFGIFNDGESFNVKVRFSPWVARWIREDRWHPSQTFTDLPDDSLQVDMEVTGTIDVKRWILSFGRDAEVLEPTHLRAEIAADTQDMAALYRS